MHVNQHHLAGKRDSPCYSTKGSSKNVVVTETSHQMLEVSSSGLTSIIKNNVLTFLVEKKVKWSGVYILRIRKKTQV